MPLNSSSQTQLWVSVWWQTSQSSRIKAIIKSFFFLSESTLAIKMTPKRNLSKKKKYIYLLSSFSILVYRVTKVFKYLDGFQWILSIFLRWDVTLMWAGGWSAPSADVSKVWSVCHCVSVDSVVFPPAVIGYCTFFLVCILSFSCSKWELCCTFKQSNIAPSVHCVFSGFLFVATPPLHSLSLLIYGPWWVPAVGGRCLDVLLLFLQVSFLFCGGSGAVIRSPDGWPFLWNGVIWGPQ